MKDYLDKTNTTAIKGIALICIFLHHFFTFPKYYIEGIAYPELSSFAKYFCLPLKICVPVFAFFTGYFYFTNQKKTLLYSIRKISDILLQYWAIYIPFLCFALVANCYQFDILNISYELFALKRPVMVFCWYVNFYYCTMLLLPLLSKNSNNKPLVDVLVWLLFPNIMCLLLTRYNNNSIVQQLFNNVQQWFPCVAAGYLFAKYSLFDIFDNIMGNFKKHWRIVLYILLIIVAVMGRYVFRAFTVGSIYIQKKAFTLRFTTDILYAPMFIFGSAKLLQYAKESWIHKVLRAIGKKSLLMWFIHCIFFNACKTLTQKILYFPKNPILVTLFGLLLCYVFATMISFIIDPLLRKKNKLFQCKA